jgi:serine/threonine protein kinase
MADLCGKTLLNTYYLKDKMPSGQIADVYHAWDKQRAADVAIKVLRRDHSNDQAFKQYFSSEAELMAKLDHPHIVRLYEFCDDGKNLFIVMDWVNGLNLKEMISSRSNSFSLDEVRKIFKPVCSALNYAHSQKIIHCDIKPANIMIDSVERVLLTDFGISRYANQQNTGGTPPYMAPEQFDGGRLSSQTDVYALGVTLYELLSGGKVPFRGDTPQTKGTTLRDRIYWEVMHLPYPDVKKYNPKVPDAVDAVIKQAMQQKPSLRQSGTMDFYRDLEGAIGENSSGMNAPFNISTMLPHPDVQSRSARPNSQQVYPNQIPNRGRTGSRGRTGNQRNPQGQSLIYSRLPGRFRGYYLAGIAGQYYGYYILIQNMETFIGRSSQNDLHFSDLSVSRRHAAIRVSKQGVYLSDENSKGGTYLNGRLVTRMERLQRGDVIKIGINEKFEVRYR